MFDLFRRRDTAVRYLLGGVLLMIALSMVVTLIPGFGSATPGDDRSDTVAKIGDEKVSVREAIASIQNVMRRQNVPPAAVKSLVDNFIDSMISSRVMALQASNLGLGLSDKDLAETIRSRVPQLFPNGQFMGRQAYENFLAQNGMNVAEFESNVRRSIAVERMGKMIEDSVVVTDNELLAEYRANNQKAKIEYISLAEDAYRDSIKLTDAELKAVYDKEPSAFQHPVRYSYSVVILDEARTAMLFPVNDNDLKKLYSSTQDKYRLPERLKVRHILIKTTEKSPADLAKAQTLAADVLKQVKAGGNFAELAKKYSDDPGSKANGGDLGFIVRGQTVKDFEASAFSLKPNEISNLVKTEFGYHILQLLERQEPRLQPFEEVRDQLKAEYNKDSAGAKLNANADAARAELIKSPSQAEAIASKYAGILITADKTDQRKLVEGGLGQNAQDVYGALTSLKKGEVGSTINLPNARIAIPILRDTHPPSVMTFEEAREAIRQSEITKRSTEMFNQKFTAFSLAAKAPNADFAALAKTYSAETKTPAEFGRTGFIEGLGSSSAFVEAFSAPLNAVQGPVSLDRKRVFFRVKERNEPDMGKFASERAGLVDKLRQKKARERMDLFEAGLIEELMRKGSVKVYEDARQKVVAAFN
ncbi:MAG: peptidylprolyl isomerase [Bryobacteraceae bacterium]|nr:peptidylprolyl isomerase [Bryobacteraceae bacterium]